MEEIFKINDVVELEDKEYQIIKKVGNYYVLISVNEPVDLLVGEISNGEFNIIEDKNIILSLLK